MKIEKKLLFFFRKLSKCKKGQIPPPPPSILTERRTTVNSEAEKLRCQVAQRGIYVSPPPPPMYFMMYINGYLSEKSQCKCVSFDQDFSNPSLFKTGLDTPPPPFRVLETQMQYTCPILQVTEESSLY